MLYAKGCRRANLVIAPSRFMLRAIEFHYGELENARVILNGRDLEAFQPGQKEPFILCAGRVWDNAKNLQRLADAAGGVRWPIFAAGESKHPDGGSNEIAGLHLLGKLDSAALAGWYARAGIYASPAVYEPFGLTVLEAALSGCALVLSDIPSFREIWGDAACYVNPTDSQAWCNQLNALISDPIRRFNLARSCARPRPGIDRCENDRRVFGSLPAGTNIPTMRIAFFCHSLRSDWNHGNAHFLRGLVTELAARGHDLIAYEPMDSWSAANWSLPVALRLSTIINARTQTFP